MEKEKLLKTIQIVVQAVLAIAAVWLASSFIVACTVSMSLSKNNTNSNHSVEQSQSTQVDSTYIKLER